VKRTELGVALLVSAVAIGALSAPGASAAGPEFRICSKVAKVEHKYHGKYSQNSCATEATGAEQAEGSHNKYERMPWTAAKKQKTKGKGRGVMFRYSVNPLATPAKTEGFSLECTKEKLAGEVTGPKEERWTVAYSHCKRSGVPCQSPGAGKETIVTDQLEGTLVYLDKAHEHVGMRVKGLGPGGRVEQWECPAEGLNVEVFGEDLGERSGDINAATGLSQIAFTTGPLNLQEPLYEEEQFSQETGKESLVWEFDFESCVTEETGKGKSLAEAQAACTGKLGPRPGAPDLPLILSDHTLGAVEARTPDLRVGVTESSGEKALLVEAS
jgi:hypothetical protein